MSSLRAPASRLFAVAIFMTCVLLHSSALATVPISVDGPRLLRVVTYNLLHDGAASGFLDGRTHLEKRLEMTIQELKTLDPDIVAVQEASDSRLHGNISQQLAAALGYHVVFEPATEHVFGLRPLDWLIVRMIGFKEGSAILSRFPIAAPTVYELPRCNKWLEPRIMLQATVSTPRGQVEVFSTHTGRGDECQVARVGDIVHERLGDGPSLVMGDFNTPETSEIFVTLKDEGGFIDAFRTANPDATGATVWQRIDSPERTASRRVDFVFLINGRSSKASIRSSRVVLDRPGRLPDGSTLWPSDHYGVFAEFDLDSSDHLDNDRGVGAQPGRGE